MHPTALDKWDVLLQSPWVKDILKDFDIDFQILEDAGAEEPAPKIETATILAVKWD